MKKVIISSLVLPIAAFCSDLYFYQNGEKVPLAPNSIKSKSLNSDNTYDIYSTPTGKIVGINDTLLVKFYDTDNLDSYISEFDLEIVKKFTPTIYEFRVPSKDLTVSVANALYEKDDVKFAHPNFLKQRIAR